MTVEAISPRINRQIDEQYLNSAPLLQILEQLAPEGTTIIAMMLPALWPADSKQEFKQCAAKLLNLPPPTGDTIVELHQDTTQGPIDLILYERREGWPIIGGGPGIGYFSDSVSRIQHAIQKKRQQVRGGVHPVVLAVNGDGRCDIDDVDQALYGLTVQRWDGTIEFVPNGDFAKSRSKAPTYVGALFYSEVGFTCPAEPILYKHPRQQTTIPAELGAFRQRYLERGQIKERPAQRSEILAALQPINLHETD